MDTQYNSPLSRTGWTLEDIWKLVGELYMQVYAQSQMLKALTNKQPPAAVADTDVHHDAQ